MPRLSKVRVVYIDGDSEVVIAKSFGEAASKVNSPAGHISHFLWFYA
jgi:hypothetical protein